MYRNEALEMKKFQRNSTMLRYLAAIAVVIACMAAWSWGRLPALFTALAAAAGGVMLGVSIWFDTSRMQWPVIRPLIDKDTLDRTAIENGID
jgi:hypothetical protein